MSRVLLVCGSLNQTTMMHTIGEELSRRHECAYTPFYADAPLRLLKPVGLLDHTILAGRFRRVTEEYLRDHGLTVDDAGRRGGYDLVLTCSDLVVPKNLRRQPLVLVQEGMTDPETVVYHLVRKLNLPRWIASTSTTGLSLAYDRFCVACDGYRHFFERKGVPPERLVVTGIPNFDDCRRFLTNDFPHRGYVLVCTSDAPRDLQARRPAAFLERRADRSRPGGRSSSSSTRTRTGPARRAEIERVGARRRRLHRSEREPHDRQLRRARSRSTPRPSSSSASPSARSATPTSTLASCGGCCPLQNGGRPPRNIAAVCREVLAQAGARRERRRCPARLPDESREASSRRPGPHRLDPPARARCSCRSPARRSSAGWSSASSRPRAFGARRRRDDRSVARTTASPSSVRRLGCPVFRGHPTDLLDRHFSAARAFGARGRREDPVRLPAHRPRRDRPRPRLLPRHTGRVRLREQPAPANLARRQRRRGDDARGPRSGRGARRRADFEREHTTPFLWDRPERFRIGNVELGDGPRPLDDPPLHPRLPRGLRLRRARSTRRCGDGAAAVLARRHPRAAGRAARAARA